MHWAAVSSSLPGPELRAIASLADTARVSRSSSSAAETHRQVGEPEAQVHPLSNKGGLRKYVRL